MRQLSPTLKETRMTNSNHLVAVFANHQDAEGALRKLAAGGIDIKHLSVVGKGYHSDEQAVGFYNSGDRIAFWGKNGAFWGGLWGWLFGGVFIAIPGIGSVVALGYLAGMLVAAIEGAVVVGGLSALGAALYGAGIPKNSIVEYETAVTADNFMVMARGSVAEMDKARAILASFAPVRVDLHGAAVAA